MLHINQKIVTPSIMFTAQCTFPSFQIGTVSLARGWYSVSHVCRVSVSVRWLADVWFSRSQCGALGQWGASDIKICGARIESPQAPRIQGMGWGGVETVYTAVSWASRGRAQE